MTSYSYYAGQAQPGSEERGHTWPWEWMRDKMEAQLFPGTFNVTLMDEVDLGFVKAEHIGRNFVIYPCRVATPEMVTRDEFVLGWIIREKDEDLPGHFVEIISEMNLRTCFGREQWPAFPVEIGIDDGRNRRATE